MTGEQLDMHQRLQPLYRRVMGEWQYGDTYYLINTRIVQFFRKGLHPTAQSLNKDIDDGYVIRIPLTIDSENPKRGLWGMLSKENWMKMYVKVLDTGVFSYMLPREGRMDWCIDDPTTAILKALCEQEGV